MEESYLPILAKQNVWWEGKIESDPHLAQWREHERRWVPLDLDTLPLRAFALNIIIGPRQAGKTTLMKFAVEKLISKGTHPKAILYARCDEIMEAGQLRKVLETFFAYSGAKENFIFLDEITDVPNWEKVIKGFIDDGDFRASVVTVSGSNAFQLQKGSELFPGRRGHGLDIRILPLSFRDYLRVTDPALANAIPALEAPDRIPEMGQLLVYLPALQKRLHDYFICGGFPLAILSYLSNGRVSESAKDAYRSWIIGDILKNGKSEVLGREVLKVILSKAPSALSWEGIAQETSIKSPPTVASYLELLERLFVVLPLYAVNPDTGSREFAKNKKLHLMDPFLWELCEEWCMQRIEHKTEVIAEALLASHLARFLAHKYGGKRLNDYLSYWKNSHEIDAVAHLPHGLVGFEMKWSDREAAFPFKTGPVKNLVYVSKSLYRNKRPMIIPLPLLLAMM